MERRLIGFGKSSYVVSLPKGWVENNGLKKGDVVNVEEKTGFVTIAKNSNFENKQEKEVLINIDGKNDEFIEREVRTAYINNYHTIVFYGRDITTRAENIRKVIDRLIALEIIDQSNSRIVTKDFLNIKELSIKNTLKRMDMLTRSMIKDSINCNNDEDCENIYQRDEDVNRLSFLAFRLVKMALKDPNLSNFFEMNNYELLDSWEIANRLEDMADIAKRAAKLMQEIKNEKEKNEIRKLYFELEKYYLASMKSYYKNDRELADLVVRDSRKIVKISNDIINKAKEKSTVSILDLFKVGRNAVKLIAIHVMNKDY